MTIAEQVTEAERYRRLLDDAKSTGNMRAAYYREVHEGYCIEAHPELVARLREAERLLDEASAYLDESWASTHPGGPITKFLKERLYP